MNFGPMDTFSREQLQELPEKHRISKILREVNFISKAIVEYATAGKKCYMVDVAQYTKPLTANRVNNELVGYTITVEDLIEGLKSKFPGCFVEYTEIWEDTKPGVRQQKTGILIDWS
jgi:hypothetical protein